jgi:hypothetical protein
MSFFQGNSPPISPPTIFESTQPVETNHLSSRGNLGRTIPTAEQVLNGFYESDKMATFPTKELIYDSKKKRKVLKFH